MLKKIKNRNKSPSILCIITKDRPNILVPCLDHLEKQDTFLQKLIIIEDISSTPPINLQDWKLKFRQKGVNFTRFKVKFNNCSRSRRYGVKNATGKVILYIEGDIFLPPATLSKVARYYSKYPNIDAQAMKLHPYEKGVWSEYNCLYANGERSCIKHNRKVPYAPSGAYTIKRSFLKEHNLSFAEDLTKAEDHDFFY